MSDQHMSADDWLSTAEAAELLGVVPRTLYRMIDGDGLPAYRIGRPIRLRRGDVLAYIERSRVKPGDLRALYTLGEPGSDGVGEEHHPDAHPVGPAGAEGS